MHAAVAVAVALGYKLVLWVALAEAAQVLTAAATKQIPTLAPTELVVAVVAVNIAGADLKAARAS